MRALRRIFNAAYSRNRALDTSADPRVDSRALIEFVVRKIGDRLRAIAKLGRLDAFVGRGAVIRYRRMLKIGRGVSIGSQVEISAIADEGITLSDFVTIDRGAVLRGSGVIRALGRGITIGPRSSIGAFNFIHGGGGVSVGSDVLIGPNVSIFSENHITADTSVPIREQGEQRAPVSIGDDVWIGAGAIILAGAQIGQGSVIAAGAVVRGVIPPYSVAAGIPARIMSSRLGIASTRSERDS